MALILLTVQQTGIRTCYTQSRPNLMLTKDTKVITQGFTGRQVSYTCRCGLNERCQGLN